MSQPYGQSPPTCPQNETNDEPDNSVVIGPTLPPYLNNANKHSAPSHSTSERRRSPESACSDEQRTVKPGATIIGPVLPPHLLKKAHVNDAECSDAENTVSDPAFEVASLEPTEKTAEACASIRNETIPDSSASAYGPALPPHLQKVSTEKNSDDEDAYGPLPAGFSATSQAHRALEERAIQIKLGHLNPNENTTTTREEWMLQLPEIRSANLGLGPRQFRKNERPDFSDRSSWTDTPQEKAKKCVGKTGIKPDLKKEGLLREIDRRNEEQAQIAESHNKKRNRDKSLLEMHQDKLKKKKKQEEADGGTTRRPFSREIDLQVNQFDDAQKKSILKKARDLDNRFSRGESKFL